MSKKKKQEIESVAMYPRSIRMTEEEWTRLEVLAREAGLTTHTEAGDRAEYIRRKVFAEDNAAEALETINELEGMLRDVLQVAVSIPKLI